MIEIVFSESAEGSLKIAHGFGKGKYSGGCVGVILRHEDGTEATAAEIEAAKRKAEERNRREWEEAVPFAGSAGDVFGFGLALSFGDISRESFWEKRKNAILQLACWPGAEDAVSEIIKTAGEKLEILLERAKDEAVRIWYSSNPDEASGMLWMMAQLEGSCPEVLLAKLPEIEISGNEMRQYSSWAEMGPGEWGKYQDCAKAAPNILRKHCAFLWRELEEENAPLRAVMNGRLRSFPEDIYDSFIRREIDAQPEEFHQARLIGSVLGKQNPGIGDGFIALRMEKMIEAGELIPVTEPEGMIYRRILRKNR